MEREYLISYLEGEGCFPDEADNSPVGQLWHNCINGEFCYIPYEDELVLSTYCHVLYELKIPPPVEYDSDYYVYEGFRNHILQKQDK